MTIDLAINNGKILTPDGLVSGSILIDEGKVIGIVNHDPLIGSDKQINAEGKVLMPGFIDTHAHLREPGFTYKEDYETGTKAAAAGGVTLVIDMPNTRPPTNSVERLLDKAKLAASKAVVDYGHLVGVTDNKYQEIERRGDRLPITYVPLFEEIPKLAAAGAMGFKIFLADGIYPHPAELFVHDNGLLLDLFRSISKTGLVCSVHPVDPDIYDYVIRMARSQGRTEPLALWEARNYESGLIWTSSITTLLLLQKISGVRLHILHLNTQEGLTRVNEAKKTGATVSVELNPQHLFLTRKDVDRIGPLAVTATTDQNREAMWIALAKGQIDVIGTDHAPHSKQEMEEGWKDIFKIPLGSPTLQEYASLLLTEVNNGRLTLQTLASVCSENPARLFGLYPRKGSIQVGSDADIVLVDPKKENILSPGFSKCGFSAFEGIKVKGMPTMTIVRGTIVFEDGEICVKPGFGKWIRGIGYTGDKS